MFAPWVEQNYDSEDGWRGEASLGVKHALARQRQTVTAVAVSALWRSHPGDGCGEGGAEARFLGGRALGGGRFINVEAAQRLMSGGCGGERYDLTAGVQGRNWLGLAQMFVDAPDDGEDTIKAQLSLVRLGDNGRGIQIGVRARLDGADAEPALIIGFWGGPSR